MIEPDLNQGNIPSNETETPSFDRYVLPHLDAPVTNCYNYEDSDYEHDARESRRSLSFNNPAWENDSAIPNAPHKARRIRSKGHQPEQPSKSTSNTHLDEEVRRLERHLQETKDAQEALRIALEEEQKEKAAREEAHQREHLRNEENPRTATPTDVIATLVQRIRILEAEQATPEKRTKSHE